MSLTAGLFNSGLFNGGLFTSGLFASDSAPPTTWDLTVVTTGASQDYTIDIYEGTGVDISIDWGDTSSNTYNTTGQKTHTYASAGTYTVKISGSFSSNGNIQLGANAGNKFRLKGTAAIPNIPGLTNLSKVFYNCSGIDSSIPEDLFSYVEAISSLNRCFMNSTFRGLIPAGLLDNAGDCTDLYSFMKNIAVDGPIPDDLFKYLVNCTRAEGCFAYSSGLSGVVPADLLRYMINCTNFTQFGIGLTWTTDSYSALIISMDTYLTKTGVPFHGGSSTYNTSAAAAHANLTSVKTWTITDGGPA